MSVNNAENYCVKAFVHVDVIPSGFTSDVNVLRQRGRSSLALLISIYLLLIQTACKGDSETEQQIDQVTSRISQEITSKKNKLQEYLPSTDEIEKTSSEELEKAFSIEYQVVEIKVGTSTEDLQKKLIELGKERWDCFTHMSTLDSDRLLCKRRPRSTLRALLGAGGLQ